MSFSSAGLHATSFLSAMTLHSTVGNLTKNARRFTSANAKADIMPRSRFPRPLNASRMRYRADSSPFLIFSSSLACNLQGRAIRGRGVAAMRSDKWRRILPRRRRDDDPIVAAAAVPRLAPTCGR